MWVVAGVLLGLVLAVSLVGFHLGPHAHAAAVVGGIFAAAWLVFMAADGRAAPVLWALLSADVVVSAGAGFLAWTGLTASSTEKGALGPLTGALGVAVTDLVPEGIVRVAGETWSAASVNGDVRAGTTVQVLNERGVRLDVWGEDPEVVPLAPPAGGALGRGGQSGQSREEGA